MASELRSGLPKSNELRIPIQDNFPDGAPPYHVDISFPHLKSHVGAFYKNRSIDMSQRSQKHSFVNIWLLNHADAASGIIQLLQRGRELTQEGRMVMGF